jgi:glycosyltransferase involved in cell wall biosynthesis
MGWDDKFVVMYSGNLGVSHTFDDFLQAVKVLQKEEKILFAVIGGGTRLNEICDFKTKYQLENLDILPFQPEDHLADSLSAGDVHYVSLRKEFSGLVVPSKVYGIMAAGRPFIFQGENETEPALMIRNERIGTVVPNNSPDLLVEAVLSYFHDPETVARQGRRARELSETKYSKQRAVKLYTRLVTDIMELG